MCKILFIPYIYNHALHKNKDLTFKKLSSIKLIFPNYFKRLLPSNNNVQYYYL